MQTQGLLGVGHGLCPRPPRKGHRVQASGRIAALETAGVDEIVIQPVVDPDQEMAALALLTA